ncbi:MAG: rRNA maturation RNase YbeY [SAR202 cluster bacterium]|nr:rRNA maturation RNase YbeY [SAR202 cluster bacterium]
MKSISYNDSFMSEDERVEIVIDLFGLPASNVDLIMKSALASLDSEQFIGPDRLTVMVTNDDRIRNLNREFKGEDKVTDVLSFNSETNGEWPDVAKWEPESEYTELRRLGDIAISIPQATRQAKESGKSPEQEIAMLTIHGILHLLGYDHAEPEEEKIMFSKTNAILSGIFTDCVEQTKAKQINHH